MVPRTRRAKALQLALGATVLAVCTACIRLGEPDPPRGPAIEQACLLLLPENRRSEPTPAVAVDAVMLAGAEVTFFAEPLAASAIEALVGRPLRSGDPVFHVQVRVGALPPGTLVRVRAPVVRNPFNQTLPWTTLSDEEAVRWFGGPEPLQGPYPPQPYVRPAPPQRRLVGYREEFPILSQAPFIGGLFRPHWVPPESAREYRANLARWEREEEQRRLAVEREQAAFPALREAAERAHAETSARWLHEVSAARAAVSAHCHTLDGTDVTGTAVTPERLVMGANTVCDWTATAVFDSNALPFFSSSHFGDSFVARAAIERAGCLWPMARGVTFSSSNVSMQERIPDALRRVFGSGPVRLDAMTALDEAARPSGR